MPTLSETISSTAFLIFFSKELLDSQFATLEKPKDAIIVDARKSPDEIVHVH